MIELGSVALRWTDLVRLFAVPVLLWAAVRDIRIRRIPNLVWPPLLVLGGITFVFDVLYYWSVGGNVWLQFLIGSLVSIGLLIPIAYGFWMLGGFGGADAKGLITLAVLFPVYPKIQYGSVVYPLVVTDIGSFALTILTNAVLLGLVYPVGLVVYNVLSGDISKVMVVGRRRYWQDIGTAHGRLLETADGIGWSGLDLDALRMYLRWRGITLVELRDRSAELRDPASLSGDPNPPTDGAVTDGGHHEDPWGAAAFLSSIDGTAYGTDPETLRAGLDAITAKEYLWVSPGIPFFVPLVIGLLTALIYGDLLFGLLEWSGLV